MAESTNPVVAPRTLYVVATPIGNLKDISFRALEILEGVDRIAAEDTRRTGVLLSHYDIGTPMRSYHDHNKRKVTPELVAHLEEGGTIALVSDAGTPGIADPGYVLVNEAASRGLPVRPVPGPCAAIAALCASGLPTDRFEMIGFVPRKSGRRERLLRKLTAIRRTVILYESPYRIQKTLDQLAAICPDARCALAREMTKQYEEWYRGTPAEVREALGNGKVKGEVVLLFYNPDGER